MSGHYPPVIIIGMHRSGTSMVTRLLEQLGWFCGQKKDDNHEARLFGFLNNWLFTQSGASWDHPEPVYHLLQNEEIRQASVGYIQKIMQTRHAISYLGWQHYLRYRQPGGLEMPWGWKDPRNTFTLPLWLDLFPEAKVIHIFRHGVDVAQSLKVRHHKLLQRHLAQERARSAGYYWLHRKRRLGFTNTVRCRQLDEGFRLWQTYLEEANAHTRRLGSQAITIKYEDFLADPASFLHLLADFCELGATQAQISSLTENIDTGRAYAYRQDAALLAFAQTVQDQLTAVGY